MWVRCVTTPRQFGSYHQTVVRFAAVLGGDEGERPTVSCPSTRVSGRESAGPGARHGRGCPRFGRRSRYTAVVTTSASRSRSETAPISPSVTRWMSRSRSTTSLEMSRSRPPAALLWSAMPRPRWRSSVCPTPTAASTRNGSQRLSARTLASAAPTGPSRAAEGHAARGADAPLPGRRGSAGLSGPRSPTAPRDAHRWSPHPRRRPHRGRCRTIDERLNGVGVALEHGLHGPVRKRLVTHPATPRRSASRRQLSRRARPARDL